MVNFLKYFDLYGSQIKIYINNKDKIKTDLGGIFTILTIIFIVIFTWYIGKDIIYRQNPFTYQQLESSNKYFENNITSNSFPIALSIMDFDSNTLDINGFLDLKVSIVKSRHHTTGILKFCLYD